MTDTRAEGDAACEMRERESEAAVETASESGIPCHLSGVGGKTRATHTLETFFFFFSAFAFKK